MFSWIKDLFQQLGLSNQDAKWASAVALIVTVALLSVLARFIAKRVFLKILALVAKRWNLSWLEVALRRGVFHQLGNLAPALVISIATPMIRVRGLLWTYELADWIAKLTIIYMIWVMARVLASLLDTVEEVYRYLKAYKQRPIKSYIQVVKIFLYILTAVLILSFVLSQSPWAFLTGLGALTAVMLLIFKDSILGLVASVQVATYDMIRIGDWIEIPKQNIDGTVSDISLNIVKIENSDKSVSMLPTYALLTDPLKNWRGMNEAGARRIKRAINLDMNSVKFCDAAMLEKFEKMDLLKDYIQRKRSEIEAYNQSHQVDTSLLINGRQLTNLGNFRVYLLAYLKSHPKIHQGMKIVVRHLQPTETGLPLEIYAFAKDPVWENYESIQSDIFDHVLAVVPQFQLRILQSGALPNPDSIE